MIFAAVCAFVLVALGVAGKVFGWEKVGAVLGAGWAWLWKNSTYENWLRVFFSSVASLVFLVGILTTHKLSDLPIIGDSLPKAMIDIDLSAYLNLAFWAKVTRFDAFVMMVSVLALIVTRGARNAPPAPPAIDPNAPKGA